MYLLYIYIAERNGKIRMQFVHTTHIDDLLILIINFSKYSNKLFDTLYIFKIITIFDSFIIFIR